MLLGMPIPARCWQNWRGPGEGQAGQRRVPVPPGVAGQAILPPRTCGLRGSTRCGAGWNSPRPSPHCSRSTTWIAPHEVRDLRELTRYRCTARSGRSDRPCRSRTTSDRGNLQITAVPHRARFLVFRGQPEAGAQLSADDEFLAPPARGSDLAQGGNHLAGVTAPPAALSRAPARNPSPGWWRHRTRNLSPTCFRRQLAVRVASNPDHTL
jgi:hypothetical protein